MALECNHGNDLEQLKRECHRCRTGWEDDSDASVTPAGMTEARGPESEQKDRHCEEYNDRREFDLLHGRDFLATRRRSVDSVLDGTCVLRSLRTTSFSPDHTSVTAQTFTST